MVEGAAGPVGAGGWAGHNRENFPQDRSGRQIWQRGEDRRPGSIGRGGRGGGGASRARQVGLKYQNLKFPLDPGQRVLRTL